jgi:hypothetical protein
MQIQQYVLIKKHSDYLKDKNAVPDNRQEVQTTFLMQFSQKYT